MAPSILHRALSFSNLPVHRRDVSQLQEALAVSNRHEGLALLTRIAEDTDCCNPSPSLPNHLALEKSLISKILRLREALDLQCQSSCSALDQLLLDTLEALKIAYPKCLSGLSGNERSSVQQGCYSENKQLSNSGSAEKQTEIESKSLDHVGERVIRMLDKVTPVVKEMFSFTESSSSAKLASSALPEDLPERRSLPPVLCRSRSPAHNGSATHHPSQNDEVAMPCQDDATRHVLEHCRVGEPAPWQEADKGSCASRCEPPSTPSPTGLRLQSTPPSLSPHPLSAPPPSPVPMVGLPMLLQSWEAMEDDNAATAVVPPPPTGAQHPEAELATHHDMASFSFKSGKEGSSASCVSTEAGQRTSPSSMDSKTKSMQPPVQDGNDTLPLSSSPPLSPPEHRARVQEGAPSTGKPVEVAASASPPPPPPPLEQGGPPAKVSRAPPPPPPGNIAAALRAKKAASKLKRSTQMGSLYRHLRDRVEGSGCTHAGKRQTGKRPRAPGGAKSDAGQQGMADALAEMTKRSAYFRQIEEDAESHAATILELKDAIGSFQSGDMAELVRFHQHVEQQLACLTDETQVLARFEGFPSKKLESLRMAAALYTKLDGTVSKLKGWKLAGPVSQQLDKVEGYFSKIKDDVDMIERNKDEEMKRFQSHGIRFDLGVPLVRIKERMVDLSSNCVELALKESQDAKEMSSHSKSSNAQAGGGLSRMLWRVFQLAFKVYSFAGGQDERADQLTSILARKIEEHPIIHIGISKILGPNCGSKSTSAFYILFNCLFITRVWELPALIKLAKCCKKPHHVHIVLYFNNQLKLIPHSPEQLPSLLQVSHMTTGSK
ncbi:hypothetical protein U9M48_021561 [Paspalum notatum var. saurae]|uniref:Hydroxyproline-rich glycoprotein family protein n=1 Tax=Paspalum notatum var. saurae TaxID=547442 RepID=A0AAQ3WTW4_PASNO